MGKYSVTMDKLYEMADQADVSPEYDYIGARFINIDYRQPNSKATITISRAYEKVLICGYLVTNGLSGHTFELKRILEVEKKVTDLIECKDWQNDTVAGLGFFIRQVSLVYPPLPHTHQDVYLIERNSEAQGPNIEPHNKGTYLVFLGFKLRKVV